jgi:uncharacterized RDD family membrane protein YckC
MNWYYVEAGQQAGPVDDAQLAELERTGRIQTDTLVWREGMTDWQPYHYVKPGATTATAVPVAAAAPVTGAAEGVCAECNGIFNLQDMIRHGNIYVCAKCKPVLMQKLAEGARLNTGALNYAGFWTRFAAVFLDGLILWVFNTAINLTAGFGAFQTNRNPSTAFSALFVLVFFLQVAIALSYETVMIGKFGATLGKMACKIKVVTPDGGRVSYMRALGRYFAKFLSGILCAIGYIIAAFDDEKRALHDRICNTRVVLK